MTNDFYAECLVAKRVTSTDKVKRILFFVGLTLICAVLLLFLGGLGLMLDAAILYGGYYLFTGMDVEYEYIITNGTLDVDKISGQRRRKRLVSVEVEDFTAFGKLSEAREEADGTTIVMASAQNGSADYYADAKHKSAGNVRIIFTPNDKMIDGIGMYLPRTMKQEFMRTRKIELAKREAEKKDGEDSE